MPIEHSVLIDVKAEVAAFKKEKALRVCEFQLRKGWFAALVCTDESDTGADHHGTPPLSISCSARVWLLQAGRRTGGELIFYHQDIGEINFYSRLLCQRSQSEKS